MKVDGHFKVSMYKSVLRFFAGMALILGEIYLAGILLILAEFLGIIEEVV